MKKIEIKIYRTRGELKEIGSMAVEVENETDFVYKLHEYFQAENNEPIRVDVLEGGEFKWGTLPGESYK